MLTVFSDGSLKPAGWLKKQLQIQAKGLSGNLSKVWPDVRDSAWIGGDREGWERVPYWLDGFVPLAYLLEDKELISEAKRYVDAILDRQKPDGWICPCEDDARAKYDVWSAFLIGKVLALYCQFSGDERAYSGLKRSMECLWRLLDQGEIRLFDWGAARWFECLIPLDYIQSREGGEWIADFARLLKKQGMDWSGFGDLWKRPLNVWKLNTHIVNIAMMFKYDALYSRLTGEPRTFAEEELWRLLTEYNGTAVGTLTGDECLSGIGPDHGTELCSVVELMYSFETLYALTGETKWCERLEKIAFNALPATLSDDMWSHQYDQTVNQISCMEIPGRKYYRTNANDANVFGLEPQFGCCTANFSQGWPKLALNAMLRDESGITAPVMLPAKLECEINGARVRVECATEYPFRFSAVYTVRASKPVEFTLRIRIPGFAKKLTLNGKPVKKGEYIEIKKTFGKTAERFEIAFEDAPHTVSRPGGMLCAEYGPLVFALPLKAKWTKKEYERNGVERKFPYCDYDLSTKDQWRYGFADTKLSAEERKGDGVPFSSKNPRLVLNASLERVEWDFAEGYENIAARYPVSNKSLGDPKRVELYPYGCAKLRMTEMPKVRKRK